MFGTYRFLLALAVFQAHLWQSGCLWLGWDAVFSFYTLSGFLMTVVLHETYGFTWRGHAAFCLNRFLRVYPSFYFITLAILLHIWCIGPLTFPSATIMPETIWEYIPWITIVGHAWITYDYMENYWYHTLIFNAWSLSIEVVCYALLAFYFGRTQQRLWSLFLLGIITVSLSNCFPTGLHPYENHRFQSHYGVIEAGFVPFASGGLLYFYRDALTTYVRRVGIGALAAVCVLHVVLNSFSEWYRYVFGLYCAVPINIVIIAKLYVWKSAGSWERVDDLLGRLTYPVFLGHWAVAAMLMYHFPALRLRDGTDAMIFLVATIIVALIIEAVIDRNIMRLRNRVKQRLRMRVGGGHAAGAPVDVAANDRPECVQPIAVH
jgi:peptidoglycan/LPS O-acetylase OafA/YrhL